MQIKRITSARNPVLMQYKKLLGSRKLRSGLNKLALEGPNLTEAAIAAGFVPEVILMTEEYHRESGSRLLQGLNIPPRELALLPVDLFSDISQTEAPQGLGAIISYNFAAKENEALTFDRQKKVEPAWLLLDRISDPGNMGTIIRTAVAAGCDRIFYTPQTVDPFSAKALRATAGAIFFIHIARAEDPLALISALKNQGLQVIDTDPAASLSYWRADLFKPSLYMIGSESEGTATYLKEAADIRVFIPQFKVGSDSLNAAVASALLLYESKRRREELASQKG